MISIIPKYDPIIAFNKGNVSGAVTFDYVNSSKQNAVATGNITLNVTGGADFNALELWITASGADRTVNLDASIKVPSDSGISYPVTILSTMGCRIRFEKHNNIWNIVSLIKSYPTS